MDIKIIALLTPEGFDQRFWEVASETKTYKEAYELVEKEYQEKIEKEMEGLKKINKELKVLIR